MISRVASASSWDERVEEIRRVPELFGQAQHQAAYAAIASSLYRPVLAAQFAYVQWPPEYELALLEEVYRKAYDLTEGFMHVDIRELHSVLSTSPETLQIFRLIIGYTTSELAVAASQVARRADLPDVSKGRVESMEAGSKASPAVTQVCAETIHELMTGKLWDLATGDFKSKLEKPDTQLGWASVQKFSREGVPYATFLHQRHYGGPFRTLLDATSSRRGDVLEIPLEELLKGARVPYIRTGSRNQAEIAEKFGLTVKPAPDFVIFEGARTLRCIIECKQANDGGTARDKASRFSTLSREARRLGGVPVFAVLDGLGWQRVADALGPVVRDTDGRVFSLATLADMLTVQPFPRLVGLAPDQT